MFAILSLVFLIDEINDLTTTGRTLWVKWAVLLFWI